jgi:adenosine deaminase CECR1
MPFYFHNGETGWEHNNNIIDSVVLNTKRIGHGFNLYFYPAAEQVIKEKGICLEVSPISN